MELFVQDLEHRLLGFQLDQNLLQIKFEITNLVDLLVVEVEHVVFDGVDRKIFEPFALLDV